MSKIVCDANRCVYNQSSLCNRSQIAVNGIMAKKNDDTACETFYLRLHEKLNSEFGSFANLNNANTDIYCDAINCVHCDAGICQAGVVSIDGTKAKKSKETCCSTFKAK